METEKNTWLQLLQRWLRGDFTRRDERSLNDLAKEDPFLADALEGYRTLPEQDHAAAVTRLKAEIRRRSEKRKRSAGFYLVRMAAAGAVLVGAWFVFRQTAGLDKAAPEVAQTATPAPAEAQPQAEIAATSATSDTVSGFHQQNAPPAATARPLPAPKKSPGDANSGFTQPAIAADEAVYEDAVANAAPEAEVSKTKEEEQKADERARRDASQKPEEEPLARQQAADKAASAPQPGNAPPAQESKKKTDEQRDAVAGKAKDKGNAPVPRTITGKVTDASGEPLIGATVAVAGTKNGVVTGLDGEFSINVNEPSPTLEISYTGYSKEEVQPGQSNYLEVVLDENFAALSEVVVTGLGSNEAGEPAIVTPMPEGGFRKFKHYVQSNLRYPAAATAANVSGKVKIRFTVRANGSLTNLKVVKSLGHGCDEEALRLLREGPKWSPAGEAVFSVRFKQK
jgi:TonB family protein